MSDANDTKGWYSSWLWATSVLKLTAISLCYVQSVSSIPSHDLTAILLGNLVFSTDSVISDELMNFNAFFRSLKSKRDETPSNRSLKVVTDRFKTNTGRRMAMITAFSGTASVAIRSPMLKSSRQRSVFFAQLTTIMNSNPVRINKATFSGSWMHLQRADCCFCYVIARATCVLVISPVPASSARDLHLHCITSAHAQHDQLALCRGQVQVQW